MQNVNFKTLNSVTYKMNLIIVSTENSLNKRQLLGDNSKMGLKNLEIRFLFES